jgi:hypothetical protein
MLPNSADLGGEGCLLAGREHMADPALASVAEACT